MTNGFVRFAEAIIPLSLHALLGRLRLRLGAEGSPIGSIDAFAINRSLQLVAIWHASTRPIFA